ncbi:O-antigen ligase [Reinekea sp. G2M2-21]|uniref:O-antigen ligase family protein n=1 Tax=Reinekea sp. G2M2-21 TaxID=2788942 RepID=UPI0018AC3F89|nr:O-antigen ligase family protein [Reinekea sp. G2M2-21]
MRFHTDVNYYFPTRYQRGPNLVAWLAILALFTSAFIKLWTPSSVNRWPEAIFTLLFLYPLVTNWAELCKHRFIQLWLLAIVAPLVFFGINYLTDSEIAVQFSKFDVLARIYLFIPVAWWLGANKRTIALFLLVGFVGLLFGCLQDPNLGRTVTLLFNGQRIDFNLLNAQHVALFFSISIIGALAALNYATAFSGKARLLYIALMLAILIVSMLVLFGTQTRAAFLGLLFCALYLFANVIIKLIRKPEHQTRNIIVTIVVFLILASTLLHANHKNIDRFKYENETLSAIMNRDWDNIPYSSIGIRINTWFAALEWIEQKPLIGHGGGVRQYIIHSSAKLPEHIKKQFGHFHNSFIELTLSYGLLGLILALYPLANLLVKARQHNSFVETFTFFSLCLFIVMNFFESYLFFWMGPFILFFIAAPMLSQSFRVDKNEHIN